MTELNPEIAERVPVMRRFAQLAWERGLFFFYVRIPEPLNPVERADEYDEPLAHALRALGLGQVNGGGQQLGPDKSIVYCGVDVLLIERVRGLDELRRTLTQLGVPAETVIEEFLPEFAEHRLHAPARGI